MSFSPTPCSTPHPLAEAKGDKAKWVFMWPLIFLLCVTIPNCSKPRWEKFFMVTFITATLWIAVFSYLMVWLVSDGSPCLVSSKLRSHLRASTGLADLNLFLIECGINRALTFPAVCPRVDPVLCSL